jgi:hypothetical protein
MLRPCVHLCRRGPDGRDVYMEELDRGKTLGLQWREVSTIRNEKGEELGVKIDFGAAGEVAIYGWTDEEAL